MSDEFTVLATVAARLDAAGIAYMLSGSVAMGYYAQPRMTRDIDIVVELGHARADALVVSLAADFYIDARAVHEAVDQHGMFNAIHSTLIVKVDFIVRKPSAYRRVEFGRRRSVVIDGTRLSLVTAEDLILSKLDWARDSRSEMQLRDVRNLLESAPDLDRRYLEEWITALDLRDVLEAVPR
jgi:predicted nucleotidyltransferase